MVQARLEIGQANDDFEREADTVAEKVVSGETAIQRKCTHCQEEEENLQRQPKDNEGEEELQMKPLARLKTSSANKGSAVKPWVQQQIDSSRGSGRQLSEQTRSFMESGIGADFQNVRIHTDSEAVQMNRELGARAFTVGNDVYFNSGEYSPTSYEGKRLLAHELTHTVQQGGSKAGLLKKPVIQRKKIPHGSIKWSDFKGAVPDGATNDALTSSGIEDPKVSEIKPKEPVVTEADTKCGKQGDKTFTAKIEYDSSKIKVEDYMDQDTSWKKGWTTIAADQETKCKNEFVSKCKSGFAEGEKGAKESAKEQLKDCEKRAAKLKEGAQLVYECEGNEVLVKKGECESKMKTCFENEHIKGLSYTADNNAGQTFTVNKKGDCDTKLLAECKKTLVPGMSTALLKHEQGHFDITHAITGQIQKELRDKADSLATEAEGCSIEDAIKNARKKLKAKKPTEEFNKIWMAGKKKLKDTQKKYDDETEHSAILKMQNDWNVKIAEGDL